MKTLSSAILALISASAVYAGSAPYTVSIQSDLGATANTPVFEVVDTGYYELQPLYFVDVRPINICDSDGTNCGAAYESQSRRTLEGTNSLHYRSDSKIRFRLAGSSNFDATLDDDFVNNICFLAEGAYVTQTSIPDGKGGYKNVNVLADAGGIIQEGDVNKDGKIDGDDNAYLCAKHDDPGPGVYSAAAQAMHNAITVFVKNGNHKVVWDSANQIWLYYRSAGGSSSCEGTVINMPKNLGSSNLFSHESGHYLCSGHPFFGYAGGKPKEQEFLEGVSALVKKAETENPASLYDAQEFIRSRYDVDVRAKAKTVATYLNVAQYDINDTPVDPGNGFWKEVFGSACGHNDNAVYYSIPTSLPGLPNFEFYLAPDRRNIMSYFKGCFPDDAYFSPDQIHRHETVVVNHRAEVTTGDYVDTWRNSEDVDIPLAAVDGELWATSHIKVDDIPALGGAIKVIIGVDIKHPIGGLHIEAVAPDGQVFPLQEPEDNKNQISGDVKTLFYLDANSIRKQGIWKLRVKDENAVASDHTMEVAYDTSPDYSVSPMGGLIFAEVHPEALEYIRPRKIDDWQIQFEIPELGFELEPIYEIDRRPQFPKDPLGQFEVPAIQVMGMQI